MILAMIVIGALLFYPFNLPCTITAPGKIEPCKEWVLTRSEDGILSATIVNKTLDFSESCGNTQTDRGDQASFRFHPGIMSRETVTRGDTIGFVYSYEVEYQWALLKGELGTELATLKLYESGEKESLVKEARLKLEYARIQAEQQKREIARLNSLAEKEMIPSADMEREQTKQRLYEIQVDSGKAALTTVETGYKKEQLDLIRARIQALRDELHVMEKRMAFSTIITPISGRMVRSAGTDTLAAVQDTTSYILTMAIKWKQRKYLNPGQKVVITVENAPMQSFGKIEHIGNAVSVFNGSHMIRAAARIEKNSPDLTPGLFAQCSIVCKPVSLYEFMLLYFGQ